MPTARREARVPGSRRFERVRLERVDSKNRGKAPKPWTFRKTRGALTADTKGPCTSCGHRPGIARMIYGQCGMRILCDSCCEKRKERIKLRKELDRQEWESLLAREMLRRPTER